MSNVPTHKFNQETLEPLGPLAERWEIIKREFPNFFHGNNFLDIACHKGWFSLYNSGNFDNIVGFDIDKEDIALANELNKFKHVNFIHSSFRDFSYNKKFDKIFIGNATHHIFKEIMGHEWIAKLAALSKEYVLFDGFMNNDNSELAFFPDSYNSFLKEMNKYFTMVKSCKTTLYTPERRFFLWKKNKLELAHGTPLYFKKFKHTDYVDNNIVDIEVAASSPHSNGMSAQLLDGWVEPMMLCKPYRQGRLLTIDIQKKILQTSLRHEIYLSKIGYIDIDPSTRNFCGEIAFDKSGTLPISLLNEKRINWFVDTFVHSFPDLILNLDITELQNSLASKSPLRIENTFNGMLFKL
jgi:hypothetical protein